LSRSKAAADGNQLSKRWSCGQRRVKRIMGGAILA